MSLVSIIKGRSGANGFGYASTAKEVTEGLDLRDKTYLVTGINSGIGLETGRALALRGARVLGAARSTEKAREAIASFGNDATPIACELSEPASVRAAVAAVKALGVPLDGIVCNAGIMALPERQTAHGQELQFLTNHVGHFILVTGLLDALAPKGRVVMVASEAHRQAPAVGIQFDDLSFEKNYAPFRAYGQSKLSNMLFARALSKRLAGTGKTANSVHPGVIMTNLPRHMNPVVRAVYPLASAIAMKSIEEGAATQTYLVAHPSAEGVTGQYFADCNPANSTKNSRDDAMAERLWQVTEAIVGKL